MATPATTAAVELHKSERIKLDEQLDKTINAQKAANEAIGKFFIIDGLQYMTLSQDFLLPEANLAFRTCKHLVHDLSSPPILISIFFSNFRQSRME